MNWVTTNIRLPEDLYMELKIEAAKKRTSVASIVRKRIMKRQILSSKTEKEKLLKDLKAFAKKMSKKYPELKLSKKLIEMRYEQ